MELTEAEKAMILEKRRLELTDDLSAEKTEEIPATIQTVPAETIELIEEQSERIEELKAEVIAVEQKTEEQKTEVVAEKAAELEPEPVAEKADPELAPVQVSSETANLKRPSTFLRALGFRH